MVPARRSDSRHPADAANPLVSVCIVSYNHERYIRECLDSVVAQQTDFPFEVLIGDDRSGDGTMQIIAEFASRYPGLVRVIGHATRLGVTPNMMSVHNSASGEFVAHLDADDCMLPGKLQQQVDFLRAHPDHSVVAHDMEVIDERSTVVRAGFGAVSTAVSADLDYLVANGCYFAHSSNMYRRSAVRTRHRDRLTVDFYFHIEHALSGLIGYIDRPLGRYRRTSSGISSAQSSFQAAVLSGHLDAYEYALESGVNPAIVNPARLNFRYVNAMHCLRAGRPEQFELLTAGLTPAELDFATLRQRLVFSSPVRVLSLAVRLFDLVAGRRRSGVAVPAG